MDVDHSNIQDYHPLKMLRGGVGDGYLPFLPVHINSGTCHTEAVKLSAARVLIQGHASMHSVALFSLVLVPLRPLYIRYELRTHARL